MADPIVKNTPDTGQTAGIPSQYREIWPDQSNALLTGHEPGILTDDVQFPGNIDWPALTPFSLDANGVATLAAPGTPIAGITIKPMKFAAADTGHFGPAYLAGCFNPDLIAWPAGFDTYAKKRAAGRGAPTPSNIVIRSITQATEKTGDYFAS